MQAVWQDELAMTVEACDWSTDLVDGDFGTLGDLSEGELPVVSRTGESHLR